METLRVIITGIVTLFLMSSFVLAEVEKVHKDSPYLSGMSNYEIIDEGDREFDTYQFCDGKKAVTVEGKLWNKQYQLKENAMSASDLQITRNYSNALKNKGGEVLFEGNCSGGCVAGCCEKAMTGKLIKGNKEVWVEVLPCNEGSNYRVTVIEKAAMKQDVSASDMLDTLNREGHIALYINFDTGKASIKPPSQKIISQIAEMMKNNPGLKLSVEGHTDNIGNPKANKTLSEERAKAVVSAIVKQGIAAKLLSAAGFGQDKPIDNNKTEDGRAKNRRVELVKK